MATPATSVAVADIPREYLELYQKAGIRFGLPWEVLAAIGEVETRHGRGMNDCRPNSAGARGPMQFLEATFVHAARLAGIKDPDICDPADAIPAAAAYLVSNGAPADWWRALYRYNPADWYPPLVLSWAAKYGAGAVRVSPVEGAHISLPFGPCSFSFEPAHCDQGKCYKHFHIGIDLAAPLGTPVRAFAAGRVILAHRLSDGAVVVEIDHGGGAITLYGHLEPKLLVSEGESVSAGEPLGTVGMTGYSTGPHLHFALYVDGVPTDPMPYMPAGGPP
jgi:peptidoglycan LD-endopeptidase LytH